MTDVVPAIMPDSLDDLKGKMSRVVGRVPLVQIDIMDGLFVEARSWPYTTGGPQEFQTFIDEEEGFPYWDRMDFSVDLMVRDPLSRIPDWVAAGAHRVIAHIESAPDLDALVAYMEGDDAADGLGLGAEFGLSIDTTTPNETIEPYIDRVHVIQCMGIETIGLQGQPFDERVLDKIAFIKERRTKTRISVDGGVNLNTAKLLVDAGADILVSGSTIFESDDIVDTIEQLKAL